RRKRTSKRTSGRPFLHHPPSRPVGFREEHASAPHQGGTRETPNVGDETLGSLSSKTGDLANRAPQRVAGAARAPSVAHGAHCIPTGGAAVRSRLPPEVAAVPLRCRRVAVVGKLCILRHSRSRVRPPQGLGPAQGA